MKNENKLIQYVMLALGMLLSFYTLTEAKSLHSERYYQERWCSQQRGKIEVVLPDGTRCDCLTSTHAVEFDFGRKWAESIGQALYYSIQTGKRAGIALIVESPKDYKYWVRLNTVIEENDLQIDTWQVKP